MTQSASPWWPSKRGVDGIAVRFQGFRGSTPGEERIVSVSLRTALSRLLLILMAALLPAPAAAAVDLIFYSKEFGGGFPHAFVALQGVDDRSGAKIDTNYGFTATHISPAILLGSVKGEVMTAQPDYVGRSDAHFAVTLTDAELDAVTATIERWRTALQPSYSLDKRNCVFFVADIAETLGMKADRPKALMRRPRSYLESLTAANRDWLTSRGARFLRSQTPRAAAAS